MAKARREIIKTVLDNLVSETQTGFVAGRFIGENSRLIYDILHYTEKENIPGLLMLIDFEKAFDSVSWEFLYETLKLLGFGPKTIKWITLFNTNIMGYVLQSGFFHNLFLLTTVVDKGTLSPPICLFLVHKYCK